MYEINPNNGGLLRSLTWFGKLVTAIVTISGGICLLWSQVSPIFSKIGNEVSGTEQDVIKIKYGTKADSTILKKLDVIESDYREIKAMLKEALGDD